MRWRNSKTSRGYGSARFDGAGMPSHRIAFMLTYGYLPPVVMHACDNPACCNPAHLRGGTQQDNIADMDRKGRRVPASGNKNGRRTKPESFAHLVGDGSPSRIHRDKLPRGADHWLNRMPEKRLYGERNGRATLTEDQVRSIRNGFYGSKMSQSDYARTLGIPRATVLNILSGKTWKHLS